MDFTTEHKPRMKAIRFNGYVRLSELSTLICVMCCVPKRNNVYYKPTTLRLRSTPL